jgi:hypothetical protein
MGAMDVPKPRWSSSSFLLYLGGFTTLAGAAWGLQVTHGGYGGGGFVGWAALVFAGLATIAFGFRARGEWLAAGLFVFAAVVAWAVLVGALLTWWGWLPQKQNAAFDGFHLGAFLLYLLVLVVSIGALRRFRFPLLVVPAMVSAYFFVTDLVSNGGGWSAIVTAFVGVVLLIMGSSVDRGPRRPYGFWLHVGSGLMLGGALLYFSHSSDWDFIVIALAGLIYVALGARVDRSSWTVLGAAGLFATAAHFGRKWAGLDLTLFFRGPSHLREWVPPLVLAALGFVYVTLGLLVGRRRAA